MPRRQALKLAVIASLLAGVAAVVAGTAAARDVDNYHSKVTISERPPVFHGKVKSDYPPCRNNRHVAVFRKQSGHDEKLGGDRTGPHGRWRVDVKLSSGAYYSRVRSKQKIVSGNGYTCSKDKSRTLVVD